MGGARSSAAGRKEPIERQPVGEGLGGLLRKAARLMARNGFHGASMRDLAKVTGRSLSGLYHYARSKEDLLYLINFHGFTTLVEHGRARGMAFRGPREKLRGFISFHVRYFAAHRDEMRVLMWGTQALSDERARTIRNLKDRYTAILREIVRNVCRSAAKGPVSEKSIDRKTFLLFGMMNWIYGWYSAARHGAPEELAEEIYRTFLYGLSGRRRERRKFPAQEVAPLWN
ncbi:MAG: TetR/AcrR family transcriptional regulator [Planctomycetes bacterium]|nr:TetR/AcrR family transcriptional regulator [Planctomycetota bacterium]